MVVGLDQYCNKYCLYLFLVGNKIYLARDPRIHYFAYRVIYCTAHNISFRSILLHSNQYPRYICHRLVLGHILLACLSTDPWRLCVYLCAYNIPCLLCSLYPFCKLEFYLLRRPDCHLAMGSKGTEKYKKNDEIF